ncbi:TetR/AcrR family transcriptional regulator [Paenibacillus rhizoplanae]
MNGCGRSKAAGAAGGDEIFFSLFGYKATTMDQVAKIANVGKGTIYTFLRTRNSYLMKSCVMSSSR